MASVSAPVPASETADNVHYNGASGPPVPPGYKKRRNITAPPTKIIWEDKPYGPPIYVRISTHIGLLPQPDIVFELFPAAFPKTVENFVRFVRGDTGNSFNGAQLFDIEEDVRVFFNANIEERWGDYDHAIINNVDITGRSAFPDEPTYEPTDDGRTMPHAWHELLCASTADGMTGIGSKFYFTYAEVPEYDKTIEEGPRAGKRSGGHPFGHLVYGKQSYDMLERCVDPRTSTSFKAAGITSMKIMTSWDNSDISLYTGVECSKSDEEHVAEPRPYDDLPADQEKEENNRRVAYNNKPATEFVTSFDDARTAPYRTFDEIWVDSTGLTSNIPSRDHRPARFHTDAVTGLHAERLLGTTDQREINRVPRETLHRIARFANLFVGVAIPELNFTAMEAATTLMEVAKMVPRNILVWFNEVGQETDFKKALADLLRATKILNVPILYRLVSIWCRFVMRQQEYTAAMNLANVYNKRPVVLHGYIKTEDGNINAVSANITAAALRNCHLYNDFIDSATDFEVFGFTNEKNFTMLVQYLMRFEDNIDPSNLELKPCVKVVRGLIAEEPYDDQPLRLARLPLSLHVSTWELEFVESIHNKDGYNHRTLFELLSIARGLQCRQLKNLVLAYIEVYFIDVVWENDLEQRKRVLWDRCVYDMWKRELPHFYKIMGVPSGYNPFESKEEEEIFGKYLLIHDDAEMREDDYSFMKPEDHTYHPPVPTTSSTSGSGAGGGGAGGGGGGAADDDVDMV